MVRIIYHGSGPPCAACGVPIVEGCQTPIRHHVSYYPERVVQVHQGCHLTIHRTNKYPHLKPPDGDAEEWYAERAASRRHWQRPGYGGLSVRPPMEASP